MGLSFFSSHLVEVGVVKAVTAVETAVVRAIHNLSSLIAVALAVPAVVTNHVQQ
jgi:hypothetical protein